MSINGIMLLIGMAASIIFGALVIYGAAQLFYFHPKIKKIREKDQSLN